MMSPRPSIQAAHPRACGENGWALEASSLVEGSSPRVRGKHDPFWVKAVRRRLIPARAGKTRRGQWGRAGAGAHPRACGENSS